MQELKVRVPRKLTSRGRGVLAFTIEIDGNAYYGWKRTCRLEGVSAEGGCRTSGAFHATGVLQLTIPGDVGGRLTPVLELVDSEHGRRFSGAFGVDIRWHDETPMPGVTIVQSGEAGVLYSPVHIEGRGMRREVEFVGDSALVPVLLVEERENEGVQLDRLLEREELLPLPVEPGCPVRVLQVWAGPELVLGRCYAHQLEGRARQTLEVLGHGRVHWVTNWDDETVNRISALLRDVPEGGERRLEIHNLTDYSRRGTPIVIAAADEPEEIVAPGASAFRTASASRYLRLHVGNGTNRRILLALDYEDVNVGDFAVPVYKAPGTSFCFPPNAGIGARPIRFLGVWIPWPPRRLKEFLLKTQETLSIPFADDQVFLNLRADGHGRVMMQSNISLLDCVKAG